MDLISTFLNKQLVLKNIKPYKGVITLQYLPTGGIQMLRDNKMIINYNNTFVYTEEVNYNGIDYSVSEFVNIYQVKVNDVLPL